MNAVNNNRNPAPNGRRGRLIGITVGLLAAVFIAPATGWLVRMQVYNAVRPEPSGKPGGYLRLPESVRNDFQVQLAEAVESGERVNKRVEAMHALGARYPNVAAVYGTAVLYGTESNLMDRGADEKPLAYTPEEAAQFADKGSGASAGVLRSFEADCSAGERAEPNNAYFPAFRAYGLFAQHRDKEAIAELISAGNKPYYKEYFDDELAGRLKIEQAIDGGKETLARAEIGAAMLFPHLAKFRDLTRISTAIAIDRELAGDVETGYLIRRANRRLGGLMRTEGATAITSLVGIAVVQIAATKPDGVIPPNYASLQETPDANEQVVSSVKQKARDETYIAYLKRIGHPEEAAAFRAEWNAGLEAKKIISVGASGADVLTAIIHVGILWGAAFAMLWTAFAMAAIGLIAFAIGRLPAIRMGTGVTSVSARCSYALGVAIAIWVGVAVWSAQPAGAIADGYASQATLLADMSSKDLASLAVALLIAVSLGAFVARKSLATIKDGKDKGSLQLRDAIPRPGMRKAAVKRFTLVLTTTAVVTMVTASVMVWIARLFGQALAVSYGINQLSSSVGNPSGDPAPMGNLCVILAIPLVIVIGALFTRRGRPVSVAVVQSLSRSATPIVCVLLIVYAGLVCFTARQEALENHRLDTSWFANESRYYAAVEHRQWPGMVE